MFVQPKSVLAIAAAMLGYFLLFINFAHCQDNSLTFMNPSLKTRNFDIDLYFRRAA